MDTSTRCPKCGAVIDHLDYWERVINAGEYWRDGLRDATPSHVDKYYFLCPECGRILFNKYRGRGKVPEGPADNRGQYMPRRLLTHITPTFYFPQSGESPRNKGRRVAGVT
jgi:predicted RNA-binding Zn-ribbon protein involved in translation (DUF1610 family)